MGDGRKARLSKRTVDAAEAEHARYMVWDSEMKGFGLRVSPQGTKTYIARYRAGGGRNGTLRQQVIGRHGPLTADEARIAAKKILGAVAKGEDPQGEVNASRAEMTVSELCDLYLAEGCATKKESTLYADRGRIEGHIKPLLGSKRVSSVTGADVERFLQDVAAGKTAVVRKPTKKATKGQPDRPELRKRTDRATRGGKGTATRTVRLLGGIFSFAVRRKLRPDNPRAGVKVYRDRSLERFLTVPEMIQLGEALNAHEDAGGSRKATAIIRLLILTGARKSEIENLRWTDVDFARSLIRLPDSKTGQRIFTVGAAALAVLAEVPRSNVSPYVFPSDAEADPKKLETIKPFVGTAKVWERHIRPAAKLEGVRLHDARHSFASAALADGQGLSLIAKLLGHADVKTTSKYAHLAGDTVRTAADRISRSIAGALGGVSMISKADAGKGDE